jgi:hypothetical protein
VVAHGTAVSDTTFGLTPDERSRYADLQVVVATPVLDQLDEPIAVLVVSSKLDDAFLVDENDQLTTEGWQRLEALANPVSILLTDILLPRGVE